VFGHWFEGAIWSSRLVVILAVVSSLISAIALFYMSTVDAWILVTHVLNYGSPELTATGRVELRAETVTHVVEMVDGYLLATVLLIFGMGLYELFISKIGQAESTDVASRVLVINSLDDLKARLAKVVLMILIVRYFEFALGMDFNTPLDLLYFAFGIAFLGAALWLSHLADKH
jgi:uncharacterized membrane protein YqhA